MLKLSGVAPHEWEFIFPHIYNDLQDEFFSGCESYEEGNLDEAERAFRAVLAQMPDHLDALHHLAIVLSKRDLGDQALDLWEQAVRIGRKAFPLDFEGGRDRLEWGGWRTDHFFAVFMDWFWLNTRTRKWKRLWVYSKSCSR